MVPPAFLLGAIAAYICLNLSFFIERGFIRWAQFLNLPPSVLLDIFGVVSVIVSCAIWTTSTVFAVGFALRAMKAQRVEWGLTIALLVGASYVWAAQSYGSIIIRHIATIGATAALAVGLVVSLCSGRRFRIHTTANAVAFLVLMCPGLLLIAEAPKQPPNARRLWSTALDKGTWQAMNTGSSFAATRHVAFAGDRVLVIFDAGIAPYEGKQPMSNYRLLSLDVVTGEIKNSREFVGRWGAMPYLFATNDGHVILEDGSLRALNSDLSDAGRRFAPDRGRVLQMSPDGSTLAWETDPGIMLIDSRTLAPTGRHLAESAPAAISSTVALTTNISWYRDYPKDRFFLGLTDEHGLRLLFHGKCGGQPQFINDETVMLVGCGKIWTLNLLGTILSECATSGGGATLAGISQNGKRFALQFSREKGDPSIVLYEYFLVFNTGTLLPVSTVQMSDMPERQSWSAFSADGQYFVAGNPNALSLYQVQ